ncbi:MAG: DUF4242 domain-containing protein [Chryseolinea sp.]
MKKTTTLLSVVLIFSTLAVLGQDKNVSTTKPMHKYVIEREIPNAGTLGDYELAGIASKSCNAIKNMKENIQWVESYVTDNKVYCIYIAESENAIRQHAKLAGFPANKISELRTIIDPTTAK